MNHFRSWTAAANKLGMTVAAYTKRKQDGFKWCFQCQAWWLAEGNFGTDPTRRDGYAQRCKPCARETYEYRKENCQDGRNRTKRTLPRPH